MEHETHLFIIWKNARYKQKEILQEIGEKLRIVEAYDLEWTDKYFSSNMTRFYGQKLPNRSFKEKHCGKGAFLLVICEDKAPKYSERDTISRDIESVNTNIFDLKQKFRNLTGGGHKIHATNNPIETDHDLTLLLGVNVKDYDIASRATWNEDIISLERDLDGHEAWDSLEQLFYVMNACEEYVVLRNFEGLPDQATLQGHDDIDFLVKNYDNVAFLLNGEKVFNKKYRVHFELTVANKKVLCDIRAIGDNYYTLPWQLSILNTRKLLRGFYVPENQNHIYSVLYHALVQKKSIAENYKEILENVFGTSCAITLETKLFNYMQSHDYNFVEPKDLTVFYNRDEKSITRKCFYSYLDFKYFVKRQITR
jgi:hypothetical protein